MHADAEDRRLMNRPFSATRTRLTPNDIIAECRDTLPRYLAVNSDTVAPNSPQQLVKLENELLQLHRSELRDLQAIGARVAAREQHEWEEAQINALARPHSASAAMHYTTAGAYNRLQSPPRPYSANWRAPDGSPSDHLSSSAISDLRAELRGVPYNSGRPGSARRAEQLLQPADRGHMAPPSPARDPLTVAQLQALATAQASSDKHRHKALRERRRLRAMAATNAVAVQEIQLALRMMEPACLPAFITTGCEELDDMLGGGGLETGKITEVWGHPLSMLRLCHTLCVTTQLPMAAMGTADSTDSKTPGRHYGLKVFGGANGKVMIIDTLGTFLTELGAYDVIESDRDISSAAAIAATSISRPSSPACLVTPRDDKSNELEKLATSVILENDRGVDNNKQKEARTGTLLVAEHEIKPEQVAQERCEVRTEMEDKCEVEENADAELSVLSALCGRFQMDTATVLDRITYSCTRDADGEAMSTQDEAELLTQAKMLLEDASCDDADEDDFALPSHRANAPSHVLYGCGIGNRWRNRYRCLIIHEPARLLRDWSDASRQNVLDSVAACAIAQGAAVCFVHDKAGEAVTPSEVTVSIRSNVSGTRSSKPRTGRIDQGRTVFSDLFNTAHRDPDAEAAVSATIEALVTAIEAVSQEELESAKHAKEALIMDKKGSAAKQLLRSTEVLGSEGAWSYAEEIAQTGSSAEVRPHNHR